MPTYPLAFLQLPELIVIGIIALLLFGKRLPEVARSLGKGVVEFKKGIRGLEDEVDDAVEVRVDEPKKLPTPAEPDAALQPEAETVKVKVKAEAEA